ncbi:WD40-repeat-containing domain protein [Lactifluus subvellereus]|nr:WD40-repeat-containing domain protein [Lactifluus subvellereus]
MPAPIPVSSVTPSHVPDLNAVPPPRSEPALAGNSRRRRTLMTLLDVLGELTRDEDLGAIGGRRQQPGFEDDRDVPSVDEHLQRVGAESFDRFQRRVNNLDKELRNFSNAARQLGSSVGILSSAFHLRERLAQIAWLFCENAADLFPRKVSHQPTERAIKPDVIPGRKRVRSKAPPHVRRPIVLEKLDPEDFPGQLGLFARDVITFLHCLNEFPEFTDEALNASIVAFEGDLKYWASCLKAYEGELSPYPAVQRYLHDLVSEIGEHIESITSSLSVFIEIGVPTIRFAQKHGATNLLNLSTVATFFSAVTATTMQFTFDRHGTPLEDAVNGFWFTSMVFSIAASVNSLLGLTWKQAMYRSPGHRVPWWVLIWIKRSPLVFLVLSVACFSVGLVLFAYSSQQSPVVSTITTVFTAFSSFGLAAVSAWFASERWIFSRHKGRKWLQDSLDDLWDAMMSIPPFHHFLECLHVLGLWTSSVSRRTRAAATHANSAVTSFFHRRSAETFHPSSSENSLPSASPDAALSTSLRTGRGSETTYATSPSPTIEPKSTQGSTVSFTLPSENQAGVTGTSASPTPSRGRFVQAVRNVIKMQHATAPFSLPAGTLSPTPLAPNGMRLKDTQPVPMQSSRVAGLVPKLRGLAPTQDLAAHQALVRHLQFSPNGRFLATSSWDRTSVIFHTGDPFTHHRTLAHPSGFVSQVAWSPSGNLILTKLTRSIKVWTEAGVCSKTIDRHRSVQSICWMPGGEAFMSVEGDDVTKLDLTGKVLDIYHLDRLAIHDVSVTPDGERLLAAGTLLSSGDGLQPNRCRAEKRIIAYNLDRKEIENQVPVLHDIRYVTLAQSGQFALVSCEFKAPPQLWKLEIVKDRNRPDAPAVRRLSLRHTYMPKFPVDFAGPSHFGGKDDQLVLCAGKAGDIHIWDRESGVLLHHVPAQSLGGGDLTCIAWNPTADPFMFATGSHDGAVRVWTAPSMPLRNTHGRSGSMTPLSDTSSQLHLDIEPRAEGSSGQQQHEHFLFRVEPPYEPREDIPGPSSRRMITFSTPQSLDTPSQPPTPL